MFLKAGHFYCCYKDEEPFLGAHLFLFNLNSSFKNHVWFIDKKIIFLYLGDYVLTEFQDGVYIKVLLDNKIGYLCWSKKLIENEKYNYGGKIFEFKEIG